MSRTTGHLAPRIPFWTFATEICGIGEPGSKVQLTTAQRALWKSYDRQVALTSEEAEAYTELTGKPPWKAGSKAPHFFCMTLARGGGKSLLLATIAVYEAVTNPYQAAPGETVCVVALAPRLKQSKDLMRYSRAHLERPALAAFVESSVAEEIRLTNGRLLRTQAVDKSGGAARGPTYICALFDESAFLNHDGLIIDEQQWQAVLAGARGVSDFRGVLSSTPNGKSGFFWSTFDEYHGKQDAPWDVFRGPVDLIRPDMERGLLQEYMRADPEAYKREFLCDFSAGTGAATFFNSGQVEGCIAQGVTEIPPGSALSAYACAVDPSGGANDTFTVCIVERLEDGSIRQCLARGWDPNESAFSVHDVAGEIRDLVAPYGIRVIYGDIFGGAWVAEAFAAVGLEYQVRGFNAQLKLQRAACLREAFATGRIRLLDIPIQTKEICQYEQRTLPSGTISVGHPNTKDGSDDYLDSLGLAVWELVGHVDELHPPEFLKTQDYKMQCKLYSGGEFPKLIGGPTSYLTARQIADLGKGPAWLLQNAFKDADTALWSLGEIAHAMRIHPKQAMVFFGRDVVLQHMWLRWLLATKRGYRDEEGKPALLRSKPILPGIPAAKEIWRRIAEVGDSFIKFVPSRDSSECPLPGPGAYLTPMQVAIQDSRREPVRDWPVDLLRLSDTRGLMPACRPWAPPLPEWGITPLYKTEVEMSRWGQELEYKSTFNAIENIFARGNQERKESQTRMETERQINTKLLQHNEKEQQQRINEFVAVNRY